jgi:tetratricopeptide (TPR) repeat protein
MLNFTEAMLAQAIRAFEDGFPDKATELLRDILKRDYKNLLAMEMLGTILIAQNKPAEAVEYLKKVTKKNNNNKTAQYNLAKALSEIGREREAIEHHAIVTRLMPENIAAWLNYSKSLINIGELNKGLNTISVCLKIQPWNIEAILMKVQILEKHKLYNEAIEELNKILAVNPEFAEIWMNKGILYRSLKNHELAVSHLKKAIALKPDEALIWCNLGEVLHEMGLYEEALSSFDTAIGLKSDYTKAYFNKGVILNLLNLPNQAIVEYQKAIFFQSDYVEAWMNIGVTLYELRRYDEALFHLNKSIEFSPDFADAHQNMAHIFFETKNYEMAWQKYEWRWRANNFNSVELKTKKPRWNGGDAEGNLYIWAEQGIGDQILYSSILSNIEKYPNQKTVSISKKLISLYKRSFPAINFLDQDEVFNDYDCHAPLGSIGAFYRKKIDDFEQIKYPYLQARETQISELMNRIWHGDKIKCGLSWKSTNNIVGKDKSIDLDMLDPILKNENFHFVSLQNFSENEKNLVSQNNLFQKFTTFDEIDTFNDLDSLAALIMACDIVLTTSNSTAHLAGALGKETILLAPNSVGKFWYWQELNGKSIWYPSVNIFSQKTQGNWSAPISDAKQYLRNRFG